MYGDVDPKTGKGKNKKPAPKKHFDDNILDKFERMGKVG